MFRIGQSRDIHGLIDDGKPLIIAGIKIPFEKGLEAHSDGDVVLHAVTEALFGALALGDLGTFFPDNDDKYKNYDSSLFVLQAMKLVKKYGYIINNIDITIVLEKPKLSPYILEMRKQVAKLLETNINNVSIKAQTNEKMDMLGKNEAIEASAIVLLKKVL